MNWSKTPEKHNNNDERDIENKESAFSSIKKFMGSDCEDDLVPSHDMDCMLSMASEVTREHITHDSPTTPSPIQSYRPNGPSESMFESAVDDEFMAELEMWEEAFKQMRRRSYGRRAGRSMGKYGRRRSDNYKKPTGNAGTVNAKSQHDSYWQIRLGIRARIRMDLTLAGKVKLASWRKELFDKSIRLAHGCVFVGMKCAHEPEQLSIGKKKGKKGRGSRGSSKSRRRSSYGRRRPRRRYSYGRRGARRRRSSYGRRGSRRSRRRSSYGRRGSRRSRRRYSYGRRGARRRSSYGRRGARRRRYNYGRRRRSRRRYSYGRRRRSRRRYSYGRRRSRYRRNYGRTVKKMGYKSAKKLFKHPKKFARKMFSKLGKRFGKKSFGGLFKNKLRKKFGRKLTKKYIKHPKRLGKNLAKKMFGGYFKKRFLKKLHRKGGLKHPRKFGRKVFSKFKKNFAKKKFKGIFKTLGRRKRFSGKNYGRKRMSRKRYGRKRYSRKMYKKVNKVLRKVTGRKFGNKLNRIRKALNLKKKGRGKVLKRYSKLFKSGKLSYGRRRWSSKRKKNYKMEVQENAEGKKVFLKIKKCKKSCNIALPKGVNTLVIKVKRAQLSKVFKKLPRCKDVKKSLLYALRLSKTRKDLKKRLGRCCMQKMCKCKKGVSLVQLGVYRKLHKYINKKDNALQRPLLKRMHILTRKDKILKRYSKLCQKTSRLSVVQAIPAAQALKRECKKGIVLEKKMEKRNCALQGQFKQMNKKLVKDVEKKLNIRQKVKAGLLAKKSPEKVGCRCRLVKKCY